MPNIDINWVAILIAVVANFVLGFIWYTPLFGKAWAKELGMTFDQKPPASELVRGMIIMVLGNFLMAWVLAYNIAARDPRSWGLADMNPPFMDAMIAATFTWLGFFVPVDIGRVAWERKSWKLFFINTGYHLVSLVLVALIIVYMSR